MAQCYTCGGWKADFASCVTCKDRDINEQHNREIVTSIEANGRAQREVAAIQAIFQAEQAQGQHKELVELEKAKLKEQKKQTQILLEQTLTVEEVFQRGFNFEVENDEYDGSWFIDTNTGQPLTPEHLNYVRTDLSEEGAFVPNFDNPYVQGKFKKAYQEGIEHKIKQDYPHAPGFEYMIEFAFRAGYARDETPLIFFPEDRRPILSIEPEGGKQIHSLLKNLYKPNFKEVVDSYTGRLSYTWTPPYQTDPLNLSFEGGVNKYIEEQNAEKLKEVRLAKFREEQSLDLKGEKRQRDAEDRRNIAEKLSGGFKADIFSGLKDGIWAAGFAALLLILILIVNNYFFGATWPLFEIMAKPAQTSAPVSESVVTGAELKLVVQVGAFADADKARDVRLKIEKAGLKAYTQVAETKEGKKIRVRVGPFSSRAEADKAASKIKTLDLPATILSL